MTSQAEQHRHVIDKSGDMNAEMVVNQLQAEQSNPDHDILLIDSFLDNEEMPSCSLLTSTSLSSSGTEVMDDLDVITARENSPESSVGNYEYKESGEGLFSEARYSYVSKVCENVRCLAVLGELNYRRVLWEYTYNRYLTVSQTNCVTQGG
ncbi:hypothetical protein BWQ96_09309 [Gracilariopsis chorda]|uniref:Uncharacterized protein n=1 Tax=Gracilariopsis chorda TaxID=448386 RepID=A0A2V3IG23_9FLOR|nr:hypothetical protein BWQ96_09309 [Gracilariopsis chorda]|eukprot:PXF40978.1 hypothetical protein BWQ96_09309 [Gracilariopsis chorda]